ncbi:MAG TPA: adenosine deaminase [Thermoanaerobaculia bacterium]|nr:adenosine deaminase [Thermoanaerobaculia bacterium]
MSDHPLPAYPLPGQPVVELHRHLDGNVRLGTVLDLARIHGLELPAWTPEELRPHVQMTGAGPDLLAFLAKFELLRHVMVDYDAIGRIARENLEDAAADGIDHIELRFSPYFMAERYGLDPFTVAEVVCDAVAAAQRAVPVSARLIGIISRTYGPENGWIEVEAAVRCRDRGVVALDLAGDEANYPGELFVHHFRRARDAGLRTIAHAGEAAGAASVRQAVEELGAERVGHGIRALEDPAVLDLLAERGVALEVCPTSNVQTSTVASYREHPLAAFLDRGLLATLNTDDPSISGIDLPHEYRVAREEMGLGPELLARLQANALAAAFLDDDERAALTHRAAGRARSAPPEPVTAPPPAPGGPR